LAYLEETEALAREVEDGDGRRRLSRSQEDPARRRCNGVVASRETSRTEPRDGGRSVGGRGWRWGGGGPAGLGLSNPSRHGDGAAPSRPRDVELRPEGEEIGR